MLYHATPGRGLFNALDAAARFYSVLPPEGQTALWNGESIRFAYPAEANRVPLPREVAIPLGEGSLGTHAHRTDEATGRDVPVPQQSLDRLRGELWLERRGVGINLRVRLRALGSIGDEMHTSQIERVFQEDVESRRNWPSLPNDPVLDAKAAGLREAITLPAVKTPPGKEPAGRFADVLEQLAARVPYPILADGYTMGRFGRQLAGERKPLAEILTHLCQTAFRRCSYNQGYLLFRHTDWAIHRAMEPPARWVQWWEEDLDTYGALPIRDLIEIGGRLTPEQIEMLQYRWRGQEAEGINWMLKADTEQSGAMLRLLHTLPAGASRSLEAGQPLLLRTLPTACHRHARICLQEATDRLGSFFEGHTRDGKPWVPGMGFLEEDRQEAAFGMATLSLKRQPATWFIGSMGFHLTREVKEALEAELPFNPKATEKDLQRIEGELIEVTLSVPGAEPVSHLFAVPLVKQP